MAYLFLGEYSLNAFILAMFVTSGFSSVMRLFIAARYLIKEVAANKRYFDFGNSNEDNGLYLNESLCAQKEEFGARTTVQQFYKISVLCDLS